MFMYTLQLYIYIFYDILYSSKIAAANLAQKQFHPRPKHDDCTVPDGTAMLSIEGPGSVGSALSSEQRSSLVYADDHNG